MKCFMLFILALIAFSPLKTPNIGIESFTIITHSTQTFFLSIPGTGNCHYKAQS